MIGQLRVWAYRRPVKYQSEVVKTAGEKPAKDATSLTGTDAMSKVETSVDVDCNRHIHGLVLSCAYAILCIYACTAYAHGYMYKQKRVSTVVQHAEMNTHTHAGT